MGLVVEGSLSPVLINEKEGGTVVVTTNPVDDRIEYPKSKSKIETTLLNAGGSIRSFSL